MKKQEMVSTPSLGNMLHGGVDKKSPLLNEEDHKTYKITFDDKDEGKLLGQKQEFNKAKKELGWNITMSPIIDEGEFKYFLVYSYDVSMSEIKSKLNKTATMQKWESKKESILDKAIKKVTENKNNLKRTINVLVKESDLTILQNDFMQRPEEDLSNFSINDKVFIVEGPKRGCTGIVKDILEDGNILILMEDYRYYTCPYTMLRKFVGIKSFGVDDKWGF